MKWDNLSQGSELLQYSLFSGALEYFYYKFNCYYCSSKDIRQDDALSRTKSRTGQICLAVPWDLHRCQPIVILQWEGIVCDFIPLLYIYALQTCPSMHLFDTKKELKRVLRDVTLLHNHPDKPQGSFEGLAAQVAGSVMAELVTFPG
jgi:hypothetical protein